jgi:hypothetical protein
VATVSGAGASRADTTATAAAGVATVSATAAARFAATATAAAGASTVSATATISATATATASAGAATVSATTAAISAVTVVPADGVAVVSGVGAFIITAINASLSATLGPVTLTASAKLGDDGAIPPFATGWPLAPFDGRFDLSDLLLAISYGRVSVVPYADKIDVNYSYTGFASGLGDGSFPGPQLDADLALIEARTNALNDFVRGLARSDGRLMSNSVTPDALTAEAKAAFNSSFTPRGAWTTGVAYAVGDVVNTQSGTRAYVCAIAHTAGATFAGDLAPGRWLLWAVDGNTAASISSVPVGDITSTNVQSALAELETDKQPVNSNLTALAGVAAAADTLPYFTSGSAASVATITSFARTLLDDTTAAAMRTTLGLGALATHSIIQTSDIAAAAVTTAKINDAAITTAKINDGAVTAAKLAAGTVVQAPANTTTAVATGTTTIPLTDSKPQQNAPHGTEFITQAITPTSASNLLEIEVVLNVAGSTAGGTAIASLHQDSINDALAAAAVKFAAAGDVQQIKILHRMTAGTTSSTTFRVRAGLAAAGTITINGSAGSRLFGGAMVSSLTIREVKA